MRATQVMLVMQSGDVRHELVAWVAPQHARCTTRLLRDVDGLVWSVVAVYATIDFPESTGEKNKIVARPWAGISPSAFKETG